LPLQQAALENGSERATVSEEKSAAALVQTRIASAAQVLENVARHGAAVLFAKLRLAKLAMGLEIVALGSGWEIWKSAPSHWNALATGTTSVARTASSALDLRDALATRLAKQPSELSHVAASWHLCCIHLEVAKPVPLAVSATCM
jgi:hypothetical protein